MSDTDEKKKKSKAAKAGKVTAVLATDDKEMSVTPASGKNDKEGSKATTAKVVEQRTYEDRVRAVSILAKPLAGKKSTKKIHKLVKKACGAKLVRRGVKEVVKGLRKGEVGLCVLAGDVYPLDVISFLPILLEEKSVPYLFVPSKQDLGAAACTKRPTSVVLIKTKKGFEGQDLFDALIDEAKEYDPLEDAVTGTQR